MKNKATAIAVNQPEFVNGIAASLLFNTPCGVRIMHWATAVWASMIGLVQGAAGTGRVIPSSQLQSIQNLEGGIAKKVLFNERCHVKKGKALPLNMVRTLNEKAKSNWRDYVEFMRQSLDFNLGFTNKHINLIRRQRNQYQKRASDLEY